MNHATKRTPSEIWRLMPAARSLILFSIAWGMVSDRAVAAGLLDLTLSYPKDAGDIPPLAYSLPGPPAVPLTLKVTITNLWPAVSTVTGRINADILIQNIGKESVVIPASNHFADVMKAGNKDRRKLGVYLELAHPQDPKVLSFCIGLAVSSESTAGSMITLAPQESSAPGICSEKQRNGTETAWRPDKSR